VFTLRERRVLIRGVVGNNRLRPIRLCRAGGRRCGYGQHAAGNFDGFSLQPDTRLAASQDQLFSPAQLIRISCAVRIDPPPDHPPFLQRKTVSSAGHCLPGPFAEPAFGQYHRGHRASPDLFCCCDFLFACPRGPSTVEALSLYNLSRDRNNVLAQPFHRSWPKKCCDGLVRRRKGIYRGLRLSRGYGRASAVALLLSEESRAGWRDSRAGGGFSIERDRLN
jgi:hypothetical protein